MAGSCQIICGDSLEVLKTLPERSVQMVCTSPPYWSKRDYHQAGQIGLEPTPELFIQSLMAVFMEVHRVLKNDGVCWIVIGDTRLALTGGVERGRVKDVKSKRASNRNGDIPNAPNRVKQPGLKIKDLVGTPFMLAFAMRAAGWWWRQINIWHKPNAFSESVRDRTGDSHEYVLMFTKSARYFYDGDAIKMPMQAITLKRLAYGWNAPDGRPYKSFPGNPDRNQAKINREMKSKMESGQTMLANKRSVWTIGTVGTSEDHPATFPPDLIKPCILAGSRPGDTVLDPFGGSGTTGLVATELGRDSILIDLNPDYCEMARRRTNVTKGLALA